ncbi:MAG: transcription elongation factor GreA [Clostridia bacterium]|nr:transcription elongation factor GreA [Clostridia bacterium]
MNMAEEILLTQEGYDKIVAEHEELVSVRRKEVSERLKEAISYGDLSENAEYDAAKNEQAELEERIHKLETMIRKAKIIKEEDAPRDQVSIGMCVKVKDTETGDEEEFVIVGSTEADPFEGRISNESSVGAALLGKKKGEVVEVAVPDGIINYEILDIVRNK